MDVFDYSAIGQRIKTLRKSKGLNQQDLANLLGKSLRTVQKYETGEIEVSIAMVNELAKLLDTTPTFILGYETDREPLRSLADIMALFFKLDMVEGLDFQIDVRRPPHHDGWSCSLTFNGKTWMQSIMRICVCFWRTGSVNGRMYAATITTKNPTKSGRIEHWPTMRPAH